MRSRYDLAENATQKSSITDTYYKDIFTIPVQKFQYTDADIKHNITRGDKDRQDVMIYNHYETSEYDDIVLWLNNIGYIEDIDVNTEISIPSLQDMEIFYYRYRE